MSFEVGRLSAALTLDGVDKVTQDLDKVGAKFDATGKEAAKASGLWQDSAGKWRTASGQFASAAEKAAAGVEQVTKQTVIADQATTSFMDGIRKAATQNSSELNIVGGAFTKVGIAAAAASGVALAKWANFDEAMSNVNAATHESAENMKLLGDAAIEAGARTVFSATESANAIEELSKAGVSTADILGGGLDGALDLAAAGGLGVADAAGIAATALKTFKLEGSDMAHIADLLAAGAGKAMGDVTDLSAALNQSAMVANATGLSIEETTAGLSAFASQGLLGSDAGTSFKSMLQSLTPTSGKAAETMGKLGISAYDSQGNFIGLAEFAGQLQGALSGLSVEQQQSALKTIFGSDAIRAATVLYSEGEEGIRNWEAAVNDQGYAAETAAARLDNLKGDLEALGGAMDTAFIQTGSGANDALREMVQLVTQAVDAYNELPAPVQSGVLGVALLTAGVGLLGGAFMTATVKVAEFKAASATLGLTGANARKGLGSLATFLGGPWAIALAGAALGVHLFNSAMDESKVSAQEMENAIKQGEAALTTMQDKASQNETGFIKAFVDVSQHLENLPALADKAATAGRGFMSSMTFNENAALDSIKAFGDSLTQLATSDLPKAQDAFAAFVTDSGLSDAQALTFMNEEMAGFKSALLDVADASGLATDDTSLLKLALGEISPAAKDGAEGAAEQTASLEELQGVASATSEQIEGLADEIRNFGSAQLDSDAAAIKFHDTLADLQAQLETGATGLDLNTEAGRANQQSLIDLAKDTNASAAATLAATGSQEQANATLETGRAALVNAAQQYGMTKAEAEAYANQILATPEAIATQVTLNGADEAINKLTVLDSWMNSIAQGRTAEIYMKTTHEEVKIPYKNAAGGTYEATPFVRGGFASGMYNGVVGGIHKMGIDGRPHVFAEKEGGVPWETYISGHPSHRERNIGLAVDSLRRLGVDLQSESFSRHAFPVIPPSALGGIARFAAGGTVGAQSPMSTPNKPIRVERNKGRGPIANTINVGVEASTNDIKNLASMLDKFSRG